MGRSLFLGAAVVLSAVIGSAMIVSAVFVPPAPMPPPAASGEDAVHRFYAAVNDVIATGDPTGLHAVVAPYFVARDPLPGVPAGRDGLERYLITLHHVDSRLRLVPDVVTTAGDLAVARVTIERERAPSLFGGATVDPPPLWGTVDVLRVVGDTIVEHWGDTDGVGLVRPLAEVSFEVPTPAPRVVTVDRLPLAAGARWSPQATGPHLLFVEEGSLAVKRQEANASLSQASPARTTAPLAAGASLLMPAGTSFVMTNVAAATTRVVVVAFAVPQSPGGAPVAPTLPPDVVGKTLAGGLATDVEVGPAFLAMGQLILGSKAELSFAGAGGPTLIAVDAGHLSLATSQPGWIRGGADGSNRRDYEATLTPGDGAMLSPETFTVLRNAGDDPVIALVLTLQADALATP